MCYAFGHFPAIQNSARCFDLDVKVSGLYRSLKTDDNKLWERILVILIIGWYFHYDPLGLSGGGILEICTALSLNLLMTQTVIQEPAL